RVFDHVVAVAAVVAGLLLDARVECADELRVEAGLPGAVHPPDAGAERHAILDLVGGGELHIHRLYARLAQVVAPEATLGRDRVVLGVVVQTRDLVVDGTTTRDRNRDAEAGAEALDPGV